MNPKLITAFVSLALVALVGAFAQQPVAPTPTDPQTMVARVNGKDVVRSELDAAMKGMAMQLAQRGQQIPRERLPQFERDVLNEIIGRELLLQEGRTLAVTNLEALVNAEVERVTTAAGGKDKLDKALSDAQISQDVYRARVRDNLLVQEALRRAVAGQGQATEKEAEDIFNTNRSQFKQPELARASHILLRAAANAPDEEKVAKKAQIATIRERLVKGEDFAELAKEFSEDPGSAQRGGDLGLFPKGAMVPEVDAAAFSLQTNQLSEVITTGFGYHVLLVTDRQAARDLEFAEVKDRLLQNIQQQKSAQTVRQHVDVLRGKAKIEILLPELPAPAPAPAAVPAPAPAQ
ncbi:peptidylprolyl isomerase [bacterium]|nr:peptidylprolyl isomerase [bacterium]